MSFVAVNTEAKRLHMGVVFLIQGTDFIHNNEKQYAGKIRAIPVHKAWAKRV